MKIITLDNKTLKLVINPSDYPMKSEEACKSKFQYRVGQELRKNFKWSIILEEWIIPQSGGLSFDYFLPRERIVVEIDGRQHGEYVEFFHGNKLGFAKQKERDDAKARFCALNSLKLIRINPEDDLEKIQF